MKVIAISGKAQNGKDTTAGLLKSALEADGYKVLITHYADLLKYICKQFWMEWAEGRSRTPHSPICGNRHYQAKTPGLLG